MARIKSRRLRILRRILLALLAITLGWYLFSRLVSPWNAVEVRSSGQEGRAIATKMIRVGAYNIAHGRGPVADNWQGGDRASRQDRLQQIARLLASHDLDVVVLNEVDFASVWSHHVNQAEAIALVAGFPYWAEQRNMDLAIPFCSWRFGNAVLSKYPIVAARLVDFPGFAWWETLLAGKKKGLLCTLDLGKGRQVRVFAVHLEHRSEEVRLQAVKRIDQVGQESEVPMICAGDFNSTPLGFPVAQPTASGATALSHLLQTGRYHTFPTKPPGLDGYTYSATHPDRVIDWVLAPISWQFMSQAVLPARHSDHRPVIVELQMVDQ